MAHENIVFRSSKSYTLGVEIEFQIADQLAAAKHLSIYQETGAFKEVVRISHQGFWK